MMEISFNHISKKMVSNMLNNANMKQTRGKYECSNIPSICQVLFIYYVLVTVCRCNWGNVTTNILAFIQN